MTAGKHASSLTAPKIVAETAGPVGDNGLAGLGRPSLPGVDLNASTPFFYFTLAVVALGMAVLMVFVASPLGSRVARSLTNSMAIIGPMPRTSPMTGKRFFQSLMRSQNWLPMIW